MLLLFRLNKSKQAPKSVGMQTNCKHYTFLRTSVPFNINWHIIPSDWPALTENAKKKRLFFFFLKKSNSTDPNECAMHNNCDEHTILWNKYNLLHKANMYLILRYRVVHLGTGHFYSIEIETDFNDASHK